MAAGGGNGGLLSSVETYNPATDAWSTAASMPSAGWAFGFALAPNGLLYTGGGTSSYSCNSATNAWSTRAGVPSARQGTALVASGESLYLLGGQSTSDFVVTAEVYAAEFVP